MDRSVTYHGMATTTSETSGQSAITHLRELLEHPALLVVDNASRDGNRETLARRFRDVRVLLTIDLRTAGWDCSANAAPGTYRGRSTAPRLLLLPALDARRRIQRMIDRRSRSWFRPDDPAAVHARFRRVMARASEKQDEAFRQIRPAPAIPRSLRLMPSRRRAAA